jgi:hypothetical protein
MDPSEQKAMNTLQWSRAVLLSQFPRAAQDVDRLEADSKFFRSVVILCALAALVFFMNGHPHEGTLALALAVPCFVRYSERRLKSTKQAYIYMVTLHRLAGFKEIMDSTLGFSQSREERPAEGDGTGAATNTVTT